MSFLRFVIKAGSQKKRGARKAVIFGKKVACQKAKTAVGGISMGSQDFRALAPKAMIVIKGLGLENTPQTSPLRGVTYP